MSRYVTIPLNSIPTAFKRADFTPKEMADILTGLIYLWKYNYLYEEITVEFILTELDLEPLAAQILILEIGAYLTEIGNCVRMYVTQGRLVSWSVQHYIIILEIEDEIIQPLSPCTSIDGCSGNVGGLSHLV